MKVIIDINFWISFLLHGSVYKKLLGILTKEEVILVICQTSIDEFVSVASRKKFSRYISEEQITAMVEYFLTNAQVYPLHEVPRRCRDPKDDYLLELAIASDASYLLTGDDDLLSMGKIGMCKIVTVSSAYSLLQF